jgi:hypothetical protein
MYQSNGALLIQKELIRGNYQYFFYNALGKRTIVEYRQIEEFLNNNK